MHRAMLAMPSRGRFAVTWTAKKVWTWKTP
jgi:hypothetical protein